MYLILRNERGIITKVHKSLYKVLIIIIIIIIIIIVIF